MNGAGNDFIVVDNRFYHFSEEELSDLARRFCPRRTGVGADGVLAFARPDAPENDYRMLYFNADGSRGSMCGNGARCLARFAQEAGYDQEVLSFETDAGLFRAVAPNDAPVRLYVGPPQRFKRGQPMERALPAPLAEATYIWTGVEHVVFFVEDVKAVPVADWGPAIRSDPALEPAGANVNFVQILSDGSGNEEAALRVRTFEKGVEEETLACGTGAMASAVVARLTGRVATEPIAVHMPGGRLDVGFDLVEDAVENLYLQGPAETVYRGTLYV